MKYFKGEFSIYIIAETPEEHFKFKNAISGQVITEEVEEVQSPLDSLVCGGLPWPFKVLTEEDDQHHHYFGINEEGVLDEFFVEKMTKENMEVYDHHNDDSEQVLKEACEATLILDPDLELTLTIGIFEDAKKLFSEIQDELRPAYPDNMTKMNKVANDLMKARYSDHVKALVNYIGDQKYRFTGRDEVGTDEHKRDMDHVKVLSRWIKKESLLQKVVDSIVKRRLNEIFKKMND